MTKGKDVVAEESIRDVYFNKWGQRVLDVRRKTREAEDGDKEVSETVIEHRETVDGEMVDAPSGQRPGKGQNALRTCDVCAGRCRSSASRSKHPALTMSRASTMKRCKNCKNNLCQNHVHTSRYDQQPRCLRCHLGHYLYRWVVVPVVWKRVRKSVG